MVNTYNFGEIFLNRLAPPFAIMRIREKAHVPNVLCPFEHLASCFDL